MKAINKVTVKILKIASLTLVFLLVLFGTVKLINVIESNKPQLREAYTHEYYSGYNDAYLREKVFLFEPDDYFFFERFEVEFGIDGFGDYIVLVNNESVEDGYIFVKGETYYIKVVSTHDDKNIAKLENIETFKIITEGYEFFWNEYL